MLDSFIFSLNTTLPVFVVIVAGMLLRKAGLFTKEYAALTDKYVFKAALPVLLFKDISSMNIRQDFDIRFVLFCAFTTLAMFLLVWAAANVFLKDKSMVGAFTQGSARGSAAILGIALATNIYGSSGLAPMMIFSAVPLFNILSVIILSVSARSEKVNFKKLLINIVTNPIILGILAGVPFSLLDVAFPKVVSSAISSVGSTATPMALLAIGASFDFTSARKKLKPALAATLVKLAFLPMLFLPIAVQLGFRDSALVAIFVMLGSPTTVTCYIMSKNMNNDSVLSSNIIMLATLLSSLSITAWVFVMKYFALI